jgi:hypothetical protein
MREIKPVKELTSAELEKALCLQNGEEYVERLEQIQEDTSAVLDSVDDIPHVLNTGKAALSSSTLRAIPIPSILRETKPKSDTRPSNRLTLTEEDTLTINTKLGLESRTAEKRVSFWFKGKRVFIFEGGKVEMKGEMIDQPNFSPSSVDDLIERLRPLLYKDGEEVKGGNVHEVPPAPSPSLVKDPETTFAAVEEEPPAGQPGSRICLLPEECMCDCCEENEQTFSKVMDKERNHNPYGWSERTSRDLMLQEAKSTLHELNPLRHVKDYTQDRVINAPNMLPPVFHQGLITFNTPNDMYMYTVKDMLENAPTTKRGFKSYRSYKPYAFRILNTDVPMICLPGHNWADTWDWYLDGLMDCIHGEESIGGRSIRYDRFRRDRYPKANGAPDWGFHLAFGKEGGNLLDWMRRSIKLDPTTRQAVCSVWDNGRDLKKRTKRGELDVSRKEEHQRLPCPTAFQLSQSNDNKGLDSFIHLRALDFDGAVTTDIFRFSEFAHICAIGGYPKGYSGGMTMMAATCVLESHGAEGFVVLGNMVEWYDHDPILRNGEIMKAYETTRQCSTFLEPNAPNQKAYVWFMQELDKLSLVYHNWLKCQWRLGLERLEDIKYGYFRDMAYASAAFEWMLSEYAGTEIKRAYPEVKHIKEHLDLPSTLGEYPAFWFLRRIRGFWQYFVSVECARHFLHLGDFEKLAQLFELTPQTKAFKNYIMADACVYTVRKNHRHNARNVPEFKEAIDLYHSIFEPEGVE